MEEMRQENARLKKALAEEELKKKKMKGTLDKFKEDQVIDRLSAIDAVKKTTSNSCNNDRGMQEKISHTVRIRVSHIASHIRASRIQKGPKEKSVLIR